MAAGSTRPLTRAARTRGVGLESPEPSAQAEGGSAHLGSAEGASMTVTCVETTSPSLFVTGRSKTSH